MLKPDFTFLHACTIYPYVGQGIKGPEYGDPVNHRCRVDTSNRQVRQTGINAGHEVAASSSGGGNAGTVFLSAGTRVPIRSKLIFDGTEYAVTVCRICYDFNSENHVECDIT